jgi:hypothetical protein
MYSDEEEVDLFLYIDFETLRGIEDLLVFCLVALDQAEWLLFSTAPVHTRKLTDCASWESRVVRGLLYKTHGLDAYTSCWAMMSLFPSAPDMASGST